MSERSIHDADTDRPPPAKDGPIDAILDALEETRAAVEDLNEGIDEINGSLRGIHGAVTESERTLVGKINVLSSKLDEVGKAIAQLSRDVGRALQVSERSRTAVDAMKKDVEELKRAASG